MICSRSRYEKQTNCVTPIINKWTHNLKKNYDGSSRPCVHVLTGRIDAPKICAHNYECHHCSFDQWLDVFGNFPELEWDLLTKRFLKI